VVLGVSSTDSQVSDTTDTGEGTITDDKGTDPVDTVYVQLSGDATVTEQDNATLTHNISLVDMNGNAVNLANGETLTINLAYASDTTEVEDFTAGGKQTTVTITGNGGSDYSFTNTIEDDTLVEGTESYTVSITSASSTVFENVEADDTVNSAVGTIEDDDQPLPPTISDPENVRVSEEGLINGIPDTTGDQDTTDSIVSTGQFTVSDPNGDSVTVSLSIPTDITYTSNGDTIEWSLSNGNQTLIGTTQNGGQEILKVEIDNTGSYTTTLSGPIDHDAPVAPDTSVENELTIPVTVTVSDGDTSTSDTTSTLNVIIEDDAPTTSDTIQDIRLPYVDTNIQLILDVSGSMGESVDDGNGGTTTRLAIMQTAVNDMLDKYDNLGDIKVQIITFSSSATDASDGWVDISTAKDIVNNLSTGGTTNYDDALLNAEANFGDSGKITYAQNVAYFLTDGEPTANENGENGIQSDEQAVWETYLTDNSINAFAYALGTGASVDDINPIAYDGKTGIDKDGILVETESDLPPVLRDSVIDAVGGDVIGGGLSGNVGFGADGGDLYQISIDGTTYTYDIENNSINVSGTDNSTYDATTHTLSIETALDGKYEINLDTGDYQYTASGDQTDTETEVIDFNVVDNDGDQSNTSTLTININPPVSPTISMETATVSEEGLVNGIPDDVGSNDTTNSVTDNGQFTIDSTTDKVVLDIPTTVYTSGGETIVWTLSNDGHTLTGSTSKGDIVQVNTTDTGEYTTTLYGPIDHDAPVAPDTSVENEITLDIPVKAVNENGGSASSTLNITVEDDAPETTSTTDEIALPSVNTNVQLILDVSGSMGESVDDGNGGTTTRLAMMQTAINEMLDKYDNLGDVRVQIISFSSGARDLTNGWVDVTEAKSIVSNLEASGLTNYDDALLEAQSNYTDSGRLFDGQNVSYFLTDGDPTANENGTNGIQADEELVWTDFLNSNDINAFAYALGTGANVTNIDPIAYDGTTGTDKDAILVATESDLPPVLRDSVIDATGGTIVGGGIGSSIGFGGDDGTLYTISLDGSTYTYDAQNNAVTQSGTENTYSYDSTTQVLSVETNLDGKFEINLDTGDYQYTASGAQTVRETESIDFNVIDNDGDLSTTSTLTIGINPPGTMPYIVPAGDSSIVENTTQVIANAYDDDGTIVSSTVSALNGSVAIDANGAVSYTPNSGYTGTDTISISVTDNDGFTSSKDIDVTVLSSEDNADDPTLTMTISNETAIDTNKILSNDFDTTLEHWKDPNGENVTVTLDNNQMMIDGDWDYAMNTVDYSFGASYAGQTVTITFNTDVDAIRWDNNDDMEVYVDTVGDGSYQSVYTATGKSELDNGAQHSFTTTLDSSGNLNIAIVNSSDNDNEDLWVDNFEVSLPVTEYQYQIDLTPTLTDTDGSETLKNLILKDLPATVNRVEDSNGNVLTPNSNGTYTISALPTSGTTSMVYIYTDSALSNTELDEIHSRVTSEETASGDIATVEVDRSNNAVIIDGVIAGLRYETSSGLIGYTDENGYFDYLDDDTVIFKIGNVELGSIDMSKVEDGKVFLQDLAGIERTDLNDNYVENMAVLLQSLDSDESDKIVITEDMHEALSDDEFDLAQMTEDDLVEVIDDLGKDAVAEDEAMAHVREMLVEYGDLDEDELEVYGEDEEDTQEDEDVLVLDTEDENIDMSVLDDTVESGQIETSDIEEDDEDIDIEKEDTDSEESDSDIESDKEGDDEEVDTDDSESKEEDTENSDTPDESEDEVVSESDIETEETTEEAAVALEDVVETDDAAPKS